MNLSEHNIICIIILLTILLIVSFYYSNYTLKLILGLAIPVIMFWLFSIKHKKKIKGGDGDKDNEDEILDYIDKDKDNEDEILDYSESDIDNKINNLENENKECIDLINTLDFVNQKPGKADYEYLLSKNGNPIYTKKILTGLRNNIIKEFSSSPGVIKAIKRFPNKRYNDKLFNIDEINKIKNNQDTKSKRPNILNPNMFNDMNLMTEFTKVLKDYALNDSTKSSVVHYIEKLKTITVENPQQVNSDVEEFDLPDYELEKLNNIKFDFAIIRNQFSADPSARVFNNRVYLHPSHDILASEGKGRKDWFCMEDYHVFSSDNLIEMLAPVTLVKSCLMVTNSSIKQI